MDDIGLYRVWLCKSRITGEEFADWATNSSCFDKFLMWDLGFSDIDGGSAGILQQRRGSVGGVPGRHSSASEWFSSLVSGD